MRRIGRPLGFACEAIPARPGPVPEQPLSPRPLYLFAGCVPWIINDGWGPGGLSGHTRDMTSIERVGFFHFGSDRKDNPVGSLAAKIAECAAHQTGNSLMVLPEAFNVRGGFYAIDAALDLDAISRLQALSVRHGITFVAGIIDRPGGIEFGVLDRRKLPARGFVAQTSGRSRLPLYPVVWGPHNRRAAGRDWDYSFGM